MTFLNIAHRGGAALMPENTLAAFTDALRRGCDGIELDVQLSRDGVVVVHHDYRLNPDYSRDASGNWLSAPGPRIKDLTCDELRNFDIGMARPGSDYAARHPLLEAANGVRIPMLSHVIALAKEAYGPFLLFVELKCDLSEDSADPQTLADVAYDTVLKQEFLGNTIFVGFDWRALARIRERDLSASCWFTTDKLQSDAAPVIDLIASAKGDGWFANYPDATPDNVAYARSHGLKVGAWTVNEPADMRNLADLDAICTDRPDLLTSLRT